MVMLTSRICCEEWTDGLWRQNNEENLESSSTCTYRQPSPQASHKSADLKVEHYDDATLPYKTYAIMQENWNENDTIFQHKMILPGWKTVPDGQVCCSIIQPPWNALKDFWLKIQGDH